MIYWPTDGSAIRWAFPNNTGMTGQEPWLAGLYLELRNDTGRWYLDGDISPEFTPNYLIYGWEPGPDATNPPAGEYTYFLWAYELCGEWEWCNGKIIAQGLCIVGEYEDAPGQFEREMLYEQFGENIGI